MSRYPVTFVVIVGALLSVSAEQHSNISLITTGVFHQGEATIRTGERWMGLVPGGAGFVWRFYVPVTRAVEDPVGEEPATEVKIAGAHPVFLIRGAEKLSGTKVKTALFCPTGLSLPDRDPIELFCQDCETAYTLRITDRRRSDADGSGVSRLVLKQGEIAQTIYEWPEGFSDQHCELIWAGDLDGDGKLDLFLNLSDHYNVTEATLFLSSKRRNGKLVERVAMFRTLGC